MRCAHQLTQRATAKSGPFAAFREKLAQGETETFCTGPNMGGPRSVAAG